MLREIVKDDCYTDTRTVLAQAHPNNVYISLVSIHYGKYYYNAQHQHT